MLPVPLRTRIVTGIVIAAAFLLPFAVGAADPVPKAEADGLDNPLGDNVKDVPTIIGNVLRAAFGILGSIALLMFIYGSFLWLTSGGETEKITKGKNTMIWAVLGVAVTFAASVIVNFVIDAVAGR